MADSPFDTAENPPQAETSLAAPAPNAQPAAPPPPNHEIEDSINGFFGQGAQPTPTLQPPAPAGPTIPPVPDPTPGAYSPEQEQASLRAAQALTNPDERLKLQSVIKREYANLAMMDGITQRAREENLKKAVSQYTTAVRQIQDDPNASWQQKQAVAKRLLEVMWKDPRTDYGETREQLEAHMLGLAGIQSTRGLGPFYTEAFNAVANKDITDPRQILQMEAQGKLTSAGGQHLIQALSQMGKPDHEAIMHRQNLAQQEIKNIVLKDTDENVIGMKPSEKQYKRLTDVLFAFNDMILAAGSDQDKIAKIASPDSVRELVERTYPWYERNVDYMSRGAPINLNGVNIPATVPPDPKVQTAYRDIVALPPTMTDKDGKAKAVPMANWQQAIEILRQTGNVAAFEKHFPGQNGARILKAVPYVAAARGAAPPPVVEPAEGPGFFGSLGSRLFPGRTPGAPNAFQEFGGEVMKNLGLQEKPPQGEAKK